MAQEVLLIRCPFWLGPWDTMEELTALKQGLTMGGCGDPGLWGPHKIPDSRGLMGILEPLSNLLGSQELGEAYLLQILVGSLYLLVFRCSWHVQLVIQISASKEASLE